VPRCRGIFTDALDWLLTPRAGEGCCRAGRKDASWRRPSASRPRRALGKAERAVSRVAQTVEVVSAPRATSRSSKRVTPRLAVGGGSWRQRACRAPPALVPPPWTPPSEAPPRRAVAGDDPRRDAGDGRAKKESPGGETHPPTRIDDQGAWGPWGGLRGPRAPVRPCARWRFGARSGHALCRVGFRRWLRAGGGLPTNSRCAEAVQWASAIFSRALASRRAPRHRRGHGGAGVTSLAALRSRTAWLRSTPAPRAPDREGARRRRRGCLS
jgi:hypothetical protein